MDKLEAYKAKAESFYERNKDTLSEHRLRLTEDEILLLCELGHYLKEEDNNNYKSPAEDRLRIYNTTFESVRKLPKARRNINFFCSWTTNGMSLEEDDDESKKFTRKTKEYCLAFSYPTKSNIALCKITDVIGYDFTDFYPRNFF